MKKRVKISLVLNLLISILVLLATIIMFTGFKFMHGHEMVLEDTGMGVFKYFTVQSNIFMGIVAFIFMLKEIDLLKGNIKSISKKYYVLKLMATSAVGLTFFIVFTYLAYIVETGLLSLLMNSGLFFHLIIPILSIICFIFFEKSSDIRFKDVKYGLIPMAIYGLFYISNILIHMEKGMVSPKYDWYYFVYYGVWTSFIVIPIIFSIGYLINIGLWYFNKKN